MTSALQALANATATFTVPLAEGENLTDDATGNVYAPTETITHTFYLRADTVETRQYPGVDLTETVYDGYSLDGLDERVIAGTTGTLDFGGAGDVECEVSAVALPYGATGLLGQVLGAALGTKVQIVTKAQR